MTDRKHFESVTEQLADLYVEKNTRYKDSFSKQFQKSGISTSVIRINDKVSRLEALASDPTDDGGDESILDTLKDLANYAILTIMELEKQKSEGE